MLPQKKTLGLGAQPTLLPTRFTLHLALKGCACYALIYANPRLAPKPWFELPNNQACSLEWFVLFSVHSGPQTAVVSRGDAVAITMVFQFRHYIIGS